MVTKEADKDVKNILVSVNGSRYCKFSFAFALNELRKDKDRLNLVHIKVKEQKDLPFNKQAETIKSEFETKLLSSLPRENYSIAVLDHDMKEPTKLSQVYKYSAKLNCVYLVVGFQGSRERPKTDLTKNIQFILKTIRLPTFIMKEYIPRSEKKSKNFVWLACVESNNSRGWASFNRVLELFKPEDQIICLHIKDNTRYEKALEEDFLRICKEKSLDNIKFVEVEKEGKTVSERILDYVNYVEDTPDFVILGHNVNPLNNTQHLETPAAEILRKAQTNIFFYDPY